MADTTTTETTSTETATGDTSTEQPTTSATTEDKTSATTSTRVEVPKEVTAALHKANKEAESLRLKLKEFEDRDKTDAQKLLEERDALKSERDLLKIENLRREVAIEKGIDLKAASRLVGTTREELEADADVLAEVLKGAKPTFGTVTPASTTQPVGRIYKQSELNDHAFFQANKADIQAALKEGRITAD